MGMEQPASGSSDEYGLIYNARSVFGVIKVNMWLIFDGPEVWVEFWVDLRNLRGCSPENGRGWRFAVLARRSWANL